MNHLQFIINSRIHDRLRFRKPGDGEEMDPEMFVKGEEGWGITVVAAPPPPPTTKDSGSDSVH